MRHVLNVLRARGMPILQQLQLEEALLRNTKSNWLVINDGTSTPAIVLGISGKPSKLVHLEDAKAVQIPLIKRFTGGGTVVVDMNTILVSIIMNHSDAATEPFPRQIMQFTSEVYRDVFNTAYRSPKHVLSTKKYWGRTQASNFELRENDYTIGDFKVGGNAQAILKDRWLHHTSFLWNFNKERMAVLQEPEKRPQYRGERKHGKFIKPLSVFGYSRQEVVETIEDAFECRGYDLELTEAKTANRYIEGEYLKSNKILDIDEYLIKT